MAGPWVPPRAGGGSIARPLARFPLLTSAHRIHFDAREVVAAPGPVKGQVVLEARTRELVGVEQPVVVQALVVLGEEHALAVSAVPTRKEQAIANAAKVVVGEVSGVTPEEFCRPPASCPATRSN